MRFHTVQQRPHVLPVPACRLAATGNWKHGPEEMPPNVSSHKSVPYPGHHLHEELKMFYANSNDRHPHQLTPEKSVPIERSCLPHPCTLVLRADEQYRKSI